jgi:5-hydroxyisourate hydrolase
MDLANPDLLAGNASITSHVLDVGSGRPASRIDVTLLHNQGNGFEVLRHSATNEDGRFETPLLTTNDVKTGPYRLVFSAPSPFFDDVTVDFNISDVLAHYHIPLALSPYGYSVYRGAPPHRAPQEAGITLTEAVPPALGVAPLPGADGPGLTIHVIDIARGTGAGGLRVHLFGSDGRLLNSLITTCEGRTPKWLVAANELAVGSYEVVFDIGRYFAAIGLSVGQTPFFETARVRFRVTDPNQHYHLPLIAAPWGYSCYRGS